MRTLLSTLYSAYIGRRNRKFDAGIGVQKVDVPVLSVGNLTMGGTGKTPFVQMLTRMLEKQGRKLAIISRGYGRRSKGVVEVSDGKHLLVDTQQSGDELQLLALSARNAVVIAAEVRYHGAARAIRKYGVDCIVVDDGFQHRQFHRDGDIVLVDRNTIDYPKVMPAGRLREPLQSLQRADVVCCVGGVKKEEVSNHTKALIIETESVVRAYTSVDIVHTAAKPKAALALAAIANPERFVQSLQQDGVECLDTAFFRDHHFYRQEQVAAIIARCAKQGIHNIVTTQKDAVKLNAFRADFERAAIQVAAVEIETRFRSGEAEFTAWLEGIVSEHTKEL